MSEPAEPGAAGPRVRRVDERLGLAVLRAPLSARTLVTYARDHVTVRTPSRPDLGAGNTLDLEAPPAPEALAGWVARFRDTVGQLGARRVQLRWEEPAPATVGASVDGSAPRAGRADAAPVAPGRPARAPVAPERLAAAARGLGLELTATSVLLLDRLAPVAGTDAELTPVGAPSAVAGGAVDRRWHAAGVLYRYEADEPGPDGWRDVDRELVAWRVEVQRELAADGRARVWLAMRHGAPVGRLTVVHDRQGLAVVEDLVVHPVHRRRGIAGALVHRALADHLAAEPRTRVGVATPPGSPAERRFARLGFRPHAVVWTARTAPAAS